ncbi:fimbrial protein (plasmid) [Enterobacter sp. JS8-1]|uniref:fimbrial protein n=1 Tax=Enterobacter sp. JS8-1 TaxID=3411633 RepID=UPI003B9E266F
MCKTNRFFPLTTLVLWSLAAGVMAYDSSSDNWNVDGLNGGLTVSATLTESPCSLAPESAEQHIDMGALPQWPFSNIGDLSEALPVHIVLEHCLFSEQVRSTEHGDNLYWLTDQPVVMMNIIGDEDATNPHLFRVTGNTKGVALRIEDQMHEQIIPGERSRPQILNPGRNDLILNARLSRTADNLQLGEFHSVINIGLEYF